MNIVDIGVCYEDKCASNMPFISAVKHNETKKKKNFNVKSFVADECVSK